jgi:hypothetical protein
MSDGTAKQLPVGAMRYELRRLPGLVFLRYPAAFQRLEGTIGIVTGARRQGAGHYHDGACGTKSGKPLAREVKFWTVLEPKEKTGG